MPTYTCGTARNDLRGLFDLLTSHGVLISQVHQGWLDQMISTCAPCGRNRPSKCLGWEVEVAPATPLEFAPTTYRGRLVRVDLCARSDFRRSSAEKDAGWEARPTAQSSVALNIFIDDSSDPVERHHVDLAEPRQSGPLWHLQAGGNPSGYEKFGTTWLKVPRWPLPPADLTLVCEIVVMNFFEDSWQRLSEDGRWVNLVQRAEDLLLTGYSSHLSRYLTHGRAGSRDSTWLSMQTEDRWSTRAR